jgi:hypothetical protein
MKEEHGYQRKENGADDGNAADMGYIPTVTSIGLFTEFPSYRNPLNEGSKAMTE